MRVILYGSSLFMEGVEASLKAQTGLELVCLRTDLSKLLEQAHRLQPDAVVVEAGALPDELSMALLREAPGVKLVTLDLECNRVLVLSGQQAHAVTMKDLIDVINRQKKITVDETKEVCLSGERQPCSSQSVQSKQTQFIQKEIKMKNLTKRNQIVLAVAAVLIIAVIAVVAFNPVGGSQLFGSTTFVVQPASASILVGATQTFNISPAVSYCTWSVGNALVAHSTTGSHGGSSFTVVGSTPGTTYVQAKCGFDSISRANITVLEPPTPTPAPTPTRLLTPVLPRR